jgi:hypothetical protein
MTPKWLALFAPLPDTAVFEREQIDDDDEPAQMTSLPSPPSASDVTSLRALVEDVIRRAPARHDSQPR